MNRVIALDLGEVRTGVAISDDLRLTAQPAGYWDRKGYKDELAGIRKLLEEYEIDTIVLGRPLHMNGSVGERALHAESIGKKLKKDLPGMTIVFWDERLTTVGAESLLKEAKVSRKKRKKVVDQMAAQLILSGWLDRQQSPF